jgi:hypothetical protein
MLALVLIAVAAVLILRAGFGIFALFFKLVFALIALAFAALIGISAVGFALILGGGLVVGVLLLVTLALAPLWLPLFIGGCLLWMLLRPARTRVLTV